MCQCVRANAQMSQTIRYSFQCIPLDYEYTQWIIQPGSQTSLFTRSLLNARKLDGFIPEISLLHMNCEGCEWEVLENLLENADVISKVP